MVKKSRLQASAEAEATAVSRTSQEDRAKVHVARARCSLPLQCTHHRPYYLPRDTTADARHGPLAPDGQHPHRLELPHGALPPAHCRPHLGLLCAVGFNVFRTLQYRRLKANGKTSFPPALPDRLPEPMARRILRIGFGALWIFDGVLQIQSSMPLGLPTGVIQPAAGGSPGWVQHLVNSGVTIWSNHPIQAASATVWIQVGIGLWLLVARGAAGLDSAEWHPSVGDSWSGPSARPSAASSPGANLALRCAGRRPLLLRRGHPHRAT